jgi:hypothetical protein
VALTGWILGWKTEWKIGIIFRNLEDLYEKLKGIGNT